MREKTTKTPFAKKSFGQNFLVDRNYVDKIIAAVDPQPGETVIEIGPGRGALTERLVEAGSEVTAIELDRDMIAVLSDKFRDRGNFRLVERDALKIEFSELTARKSPDAIQSAKLVANLPYYISTAILQNLIEQRAIFSEMILMFQREVVERITASPGSRERGFLSVLVEAFLESEKLFDVPPSAFRPAPKIWSAVVRLRPKTESGIENEPLFRGLISAAFAQKRKTILNNLKSAPADLRKALGNLEETLEIAGIVPQRRAESLSLDEWRRIADNLV